MSQSCLSKCVVGDKITICYTVDGRISNKPTPYCREFEVVEVAAYNGTSYPIIGSNFEADRMRISYGYKTDYTWTVDNRTSHVTKIVKKRI